MRSFVSIFFLMIPFVVSGQKLPEIDALNRVILNHKDSIIYAHLLPAESNSKITASDRYWYNWYAQHDIKETKGGFGGKLLHGAYTEYYENKDLKKKGNFKKGLKSGKWKAWHKNGQLAEIAFYKNGLKNGKTTSYDSRGALVSVKKYKKGVLQIKKGKKVKTSQPKDSVNVKADQKRKNQGKSSKKNSGNELKKKNKNKEAVPENVNPPTNSDKPILPEPQNEKQEKKVKKAKKEKSPEIRIRKGIKVVPQPGKST